MCLEYRGSLVTAVLHTTYSGFKCESRILRSNKVTIWYMEKIILSTCHKKVKNFYLIFFCVLTYLPYFWKKKNPSKEKGEMLIFPGCEVINKTNKFPFIFLSKFSPKKTFIYLFIIFLHSIFIWLPPTPKTLIKFCYK